jgi:hypothetical protein
MSSFNSIDREDLACLGVLIAHVTGLTIKLNGH